MTGARVNEEQGGYVFTCTETVPDFNFYIGTTKVTIPGSYIAFSPIATGSATCFGGLQTNAGIGLNIFGDIAIKSAFVVFEQSGSSPRLGFAAKTLKSTTPGR